MSEEQADLNFIRRDWMSSPWQDTKCELKGLFGIESCRVNRVHEGQAEVWKPVKEAKKMVRKVDGKPDTRSRKG